MLRRITALCSNQCPSPASTNTPVGLSAACHRRLLPICDRHSCLPYSHPTVIMKPISVRMKLDTKRYTTIKKSLFKKQDNKLYFTCQRKYFNPVGINPESFNFIMRRYRLFSLFYNYFVFLSTIRVSSSGVLFFTN